MKQYKKLKTNTQTALLLILIIALISSLASAKFIPAIQLPNNTYLLTENVLARYRVCTADNEREAVHYAIKAELSDVYKMNWEYEYKRADGMEKQKNDYVWWFVGGLIIGAITK